MPATLLWYDLETFGTHRQWDRIASFGCVRTDFDLNEVEAPVLRYCRQSPDYLPHPEACLVSRLTPELVNRKGVSEREFAEVIHTELSRPLTCTAGFNTIRFDDEFIRSLFYRNFYDPYAREHRDGNSRWDIIDLARLCHDLRPDGIKWVRDAEGKPSFKLVELARANNITQETPHEALSDVRATIGLARLIRDRQPQLYDYYFRLRNKDEVRRRVSLGNPEPVVHTSGQFTSVHGCTTLVTPLTGHPDQTNVIIAYDLRRDPDDWMDCDAEEIRRRVFTKASELAPDERIPLKGIHLNRAPAVAPLGTLSEERAVALGIDIERCLRNAAKLRSRPEIAAKIRSIYAQHQWSKPRDIDLQIYSGSFFPEVDRAQFDQIPGTSPEQLLRTPPRLHDPRGPQMVWRYLCRNYPKALPEPEARKWRSFCATRLLTPEPDAAMDIGTYMRNVRTRLETIDTPAEDKRLLKNLLDYGTHLERTVLG